MKTTQVICTTVQHQVGSTLNVLQKIEEIAGRPTQVCKVEVLTEEADTTFTPGKTYELSFKPVESMLSVEKSDAK